MFFYPGTYPLVVTGIRSYWQNAIELTGVSGTFSTALAAADGVFISALHFVKTAAS